MDHRDGLGLTQDVIMHSMKGKERAVTTKEAELGKCRDQPFPREELPENWFEEELKRIDERGEEVKKFMREGLDIGMIDGVGGRRHSPYMEKYSERELMEIIWCASGPFLEKLAEESLKRLLRERRIERLLERGVEDW